MREILFRGKDESGEWHYGDFKKGINGNSIIGGYEITNPTQLDPCGDTVYFYNEVIPETVGMGVKLPDNSWMFHGDVIKGLGVSDNVINFFLWFDGIEFILCKCKVKDYEGNHIRWGTLSRGFEVYDKYGFKIERIGNIYDNPELLKVKP